MMGSLKGLKNYPSLFKSDFRTCCSDHPKNLILLFISKIHLFLNLTRLVIDKKTINLCFLFKTVKKHSVFSELLRLFFRLIK